MEAGFWHNLWKTNEIGFHKNDTNKFLLEFFPLLDLKKGERVFIPLCGKTLDIKWLLNEGYRVVGAELNEDAIKELFRSLHVEPRVTTVGSLTLYSAEGIDIFVGDIFELDKKSMGEVDAVYDRGAVVALPESMRIDYTALLMEITEGAPQLVITFDYDQTLVEGPPFSVKESFLKDYYGSSYNIRLLHSERSVDFKEINASEIVCLLSVK